MTGNSPRVLVVDAERFFREAIRDTLAAADIACQTAADGEEALAVAREADFAVVVLDLGLPGAGGLDVLHRLREIDPVARVIVLSSQAEQAAVLDALRMEAADYLAKPLHDEELVLAVQRALRGHAAELRHAALRDRICALDARVAELCERAAAGDPAGRAAALGPGIAETVSVVLGAEKASLMLMDGDGTLRVTASVGHALPPEEMDAAVPGESVAGVAVSAGEPLVIADVDEDLRFAGRPRGGRYRSRSLVVTPLAAGGSPFGVLCATDREDGGVFEASDLALLRILAAQVGQILAGPAVATPPPAPEPEEPPIEVAAPRAGAEEDARDVQLARAVCEAVTREVEPERLVAAALRAVADALPADPVGLHLIDNATGRLCLEGRFEGTGPAERDGIGRTSGLTGGVLQTGRLVACDHPDKDPRFDPEVDTPADGVIRPFVCVPVQMRGKTLGVLRAFPRPGAEASARTAEILAAAISAAVRNLLLYRSLLESIDEVARVRRGQRTGGRS